MNARALTAETELATLRAEVERVTAERDAADRERTDMMWQRRRAEERADAAEAENTRLTAQLAGAVEALKPLAEAAAYHEHTHDDACVIAIPGRPGRDQPRVGYLRRARAALADLTPTP